MGQAADETAFFKSRNQPMNARLGPQVESILHFVERGCDTIDAEAFVDKDQ
jgi:hypothetical protein